MLRENIRSLRADIFRGTAIAITVVQLGACGGDENISEPDVTDDVTAAIDAPSTANLSCNAGVSVHYSGENSTGQIETWEWKAAQGVIGTSPTVDRTFYSPDESEWTQLKVCGSGAVCDSTKHILAVEPAVGCLEVAAEGDWRLILPPGGEVVGNYSLENSTGDIERYLWLLDGDSIGSQPTLQIAFNEIGRHRIDGIIANSVMADTAILTTIVKEEGSCPPQLRSDSLAFFRQEERDGVNVYGLYFMHGMDGGVSGPVFESAEVRFYNSQEPCGNRVVFGLLDADTKNDIYVINKDGSGLTLLAGKAGIEWHPSWGVNDWIAYVDDTRWDGARDEIALTKPDASNQFYLSGATVDRATTGFYPAFDPSGDVLALGSVRLEPTDSSARIYLYSGVISGTREMRPLHTDDQLVEIYGTRKVFEGSAGIAWSPDSLWIAYTVSVGYADEIKIVVSPSDGSGSVRFIQEGSLSVSPSWSPDSHNIVYSHVFPDGRVHIYRTPLEGGAPVDLSARSLGSKVGVRDWAPSWAE